jgi:hypothetical protein
MINLTEEEQEVILGKLRKLLDAEEHLPEWANAMFISSKEVEIWIDPTALDYPSIPSEIDGVPIKTKFKGPGQAC